jgi:hypothetical protein
MMAKNGRPICGGVPAAHQRISLHSPSNRDPSTYSRPRVLPIPLLHLVKVVAAAYSLLAVLGIGTWDGFYPVDS